MYSIPMTFVGFAIIRMAVISFALSKPFDDPRIVVPVLFIAASVCGWAGWLLTIHGFKKESEQKKALKLVTAG